ncbi:MAG TPA: cupredoxin domain-containing protein [Gemmatimonadaceae bacterium]
MITLSATDWLVIAAGLGAVAWVNWYFFFAERSAATAKANASGRQDITVVVRGGYEPATIRVKAGRPVRLAFDRQETSGCSEEIVFPDFNLRKFLPAYQRTLIELTPPKAGVYEFTCGMSMLHGRVIAE